MPIKKNDLVVTKDPWPVDQRGPWNTPGLVIRGPYEDVIKLQTTPILVSAITLVVDVMVDGKIWSAIPIDRLHRIPR